MNLETIKQELGGHQKKIYDLLSEKNKKELTITNLTNEINTLRARTEQITLEIVGEEGIVEALIFILKEFNKEESKQNVSV